MKVYINGQGHMTKMATMVINRKKIFKNLFLQNQKAYDFETWHEASGGGAMQTAQPRSDAIFVLVSCYMLVICTPIH